MGIKDSYKYEHGTRRVTESGHARRATNQNILVIKHMKKVETCLATTMNIHIITIHRNINTFQWHIITFHWHIINFHRPVIINPGMFSKIT